ncbi:hypothetical protein DAEQUDRAFT_389168 [Daedalea quercina L-15889]|uniref:Uncharacterized protein n=1 Tax=Daedalea quercina L-15889 TaxID=1314783 RepID=A0A165NZD3_9APHY|nr:hypothetical protein DAEQUDRAFT_389168 [Daedalea quercina L-15889]
MIAVRDRLSAIERAIEELHQQGIQHPNTEEKALTGHASVDASFSTVPLDSPTSKGSQRSVSSSPVREAWWLGGNKHHASVDVPSPASSSGASTPGPLLSDGSSFYSSVASCEYEARRFRCHEVREVPRRHWLSPLYKREQGKTSVTGGISIENVHGNIGKLTVEGPHMTRRERN